MTYPSPDAAATAVAEAGARNLAGRKIADGFSWPECPRWHDGAFWFSDMYTATLKTLDAEGKATVVVDATARRANTDVPIVLGGFGWLPDGRLIVVSMHERLVLVHGGTSPDDLSVYADISEHCLAAANDMVVDADGRAYVTQLGFDIFAGEAPVPSPIIVVEPDATTHTADKVGPLMCANGITISSDGSKVYTAEVMANKITVIDRDSEGNLSNPREFAACPFLPDGIGLDEQGGVWAAMPGSGYVARFVDGGTITDAVAIPLENGTASACMLGGPDRSTLYMTVGVEVFDFEKSAREAQATIWVADTGYHGGDTRP
ncbi:SMP-30/gluconolactonase/LRE family protein [Gordonia sp. NPDC003424]